MFGQPRFKVFCCQHGLDGRSHAEIRISSFCDRRSAPVRSKAGQNPKAPRDGSQWEQPISSQRPKEREQPAGGPGAVTLRTPPSAPACRGCCDQGATQRGSFRDRNALSGSCGGRSPKSRASLEGAGFPSVSPGCRSPHGILPERVCQIPPSPADPGGTGRGPTLLWHGLF